MANFNQQGMNGGMIPVQYPYTNNLIMNTPYDNYLGRNNEKKKKKLLLII